MVPHKAIEARSLLKNFMMGGKCGSEFDLWYFLLRDAGQEVVHLLGSSSPYVDRFGVRNTEQGLCHFGCLIAGVPVPLQIKDQRPEGVSSTVEQRQILRLSSQDSPGKAKNGLHHWPKL